MPMNYWRRFLRLVQTIIREPLWRIKETVKVLDGKGEKGGKREATEAAALQNLLRRFIFPREPQCHDRVKPIDFHIFINVKVK